MTAFTANNISLDILLANALILFTFKKIILDRFKSGFIKYILGMIFAYGLLGCLMYLGLKYEFINEAFQGARFRFFGIRFSDVGIIPYIIPAIYSVYFVGYFDKEKDWKKVRTMMLSVFVNGIFAFIGAMLFGSYLKGDSLEEIITRLKASVEYIDWKFIPPMIAILVLFYCVMKYDYFKHHKK